MDIIKYNTRIIQKHDTEANWDNSDLIPLQSELIIYDADSYYPYQRFKVGNGETKVKELPFIIHNPIWSGTMEEYNAMKAYIAIGTIVCITDGENAETSSTTAKLGIAILGTMILGQE